MIGWKVVCDIDGKEVVAEVASQPFSWGDDGRFGLLVNHDSFLKPIYLNANQSLKVIEK